ncbi:Cyclase/dehydrase [Nitrospira sp. KM1]|uniref:SRPBCC family protein n=1 Tax=Nitrospira sp. KM1 TaxID=1936990 RepID=UPI0013A77EF6|nr:SRPBCC family protein [Nitrospira sp. KM1]BCA55975.1 Cyclase/dehydrase [Nitrospira sp. KM1]
MSLIEKGVEISVPVTVAYNQWTQFEEFPRFMNGVEQVTQLDTTHLKWKANIGGKTEEWTAEITEQVPDERIAWKSLDGTQNAGVVTFHRLSDTRSKVMLQLQYEPHGMVENVGEAIGVVSNRVESDLERFKTYIEARGKETGGWRGTVKH